MTSKFHPLDTDSDRASWTEFFQYAFGGTKSKPVALELKQKPDGAVWARGIATDGTVKIFRTDTDAERAVRDENAKNYLQALDRLWKLNPKNKMPREFNATAFNTLRAMATASARYHCRFRSSATANPEANA